MSRIEPVVGPNTWVMPDITLHHGYIESSAKGWHWDHQLADLILNLREDGRLCVIDEQENQPEPKLICSMGLA